MKREDIKNITIETLQEVGVSISKVIRFKDTMTTKEVVAYLGCDRHWLYDNKSLFNGRIKNRRGDYIYDTDKVVQYYMNNTQNTI